MSQKFDEIVIIYNPNSSGDGKDNAKNFKATLGQLGCTTPVTLRETERAGHAEDIALEYSRSDKSVLLISSSGDGGYHEMVNGIMASSANNITAGVLPSGNANDHFHALVEDEDKLVQNILSGSVRKIDILKVSLIENGKKRSRFAHSYAGIGLTPTIGEQLTKTDLNLFNEKIVVLKYLFKYTHATIRINGKKKRFSSLVFSNIKHMSKVLTLAQSNSINDGEFEISAIRYRSKLYAIALLIKSATFGLEELGSYTHYTFMTTNHLLMQLDGEVYTIDKNSRVTVECVAGEFATIL